MRREPTAAPAAITPTEQRADQPSKNGKPRSKGSFLRELPVLIVLALVLALLIKTFLVQAFYIPSASMEPTLNGPGDRVLVNRIVYRFHPPRRGDIIVFSDPHAPPVHRNPVEAAAHWMTSGLGFSRGSPTDYIKRVIGLPGETVEVRNGIVFIDGRPLQPEPYVSPVRDHSDWGPDQVPPGELFVMGDNRTDSDDSRGTLGFIPIKDVIGRAFVIIWPPGRWRWLSTPSYTSPPPSS
ncbi:MAG TPA: signal peptidase I [Actinomycetota bacterium]|jgi:signal peptidase I